MFSLPGNGSKLPGCQYSYGIGKCIGKGLLYVKPQLTSLVIKMSVCMLWLLAVPISWTLIRNCLMSSNGKDFVGVMSIIITQRVCHKQPPIISISRLTPSFLCIQCA